MIKPNGARVVIKAIKGSAESMQKIASGLYVPTKLTSTDDKFVRGTIIAVGEGRLTDQNIRIPTPFTVGQIAIYNKFNAAEIIDDDGEIVAIIDEFNVIGTEG